MTKISILLMLFFYSITGMSQTIESIGEMMNKQQYKEAKTAIDAFLANPKNAGKADGWYYKGRIYNSLSSEKDVSTMEAYELKLQAYDAFKKTQQLDEKDLRLKMEQYSSYMYLYFGFFDLGANLYNAKDFGNAFNSFANALEVKDYILAKNYTYTEMKFYPLDTALVLNTAIAAMQAKKNDGAALYYRKLTDANVSGDGYQEVYEFLADYYLQNKDSVNLQAILDKGKMFYPKSDYWTSLEIDEVRKSGDQAVLFAKYEELIAKYPDNFVLRYNYAIELFNSIYGKDAKPGDQKAAKEKLTKELIATIPVDKGIDATVLLTKHLYNMSSDLSIAANLAKGTKPEDVKKKADLVAQTNKQMDEFLVYANKAAVYYDAQPTLKPIQKATFQELLSNMIEIYTYKKDTKKAAEIEKKKAAL